MTNLRLITRSACALGAAMLATTALQSTPAQARVNASGHIRASTHVSGHVSAHVTTAHQGFRIGRLAPGSSFGTKQPGRGDIFTKPNGVSDGSGGPEVGTHTIPLQPPPGTKFPGTGPNVPDYPGGSKTPPILSGTPTPSPVPPASRPTSTGNLPGSKPPVIIITNPGPIPPVVVGNPTRTPLPPTSGPTNPGNYPKQPPVIVATPTPVPIPVPVPSGSSPGYGTGTTYTHQYGQVGVYADVGAGGESYEPCQWFKNNYDRTGNVYWLRRYKVCLWQH